MGAAELLASLHRSGLRVRAEGLQLIVSPAERLSEAHRLAIQADRDSLLAACLDPDTRVVCATCSRAHGEWCAAHPASGLPRGYIGGIVNQLQQCHAWQGATP